MRAVEVEVRVVELVRIRGVAGHVVAIGREVVDETNFQCLARLHAQRRSWRPAFVAAQIEAFALDMAIGVGAAQAGAEQAIRRLAHLGLDQRLIHRWYDRRLRKAEIGAHTGMSFHELAQRSAPAQSQRTGH